MSDSTRGNGNKASPILSDRLTSMSWKDWALSVLLHLLVGGIILGVAYRMPAENPTISTGSPNPETAKQASISRILQDPERVRDITRQIVEKQTEQYSKKVGELIDIEAKLSELNEERLDAYQKISEEAALEKLRDVAEGQKMIAESQSKLSEKIQNLKDQLASAQKSPSTPDIKDAISPMFSEMERLLQSINQSQKEVAENQSDASEFEELKSPEDAAAQKNAMDAQTQASSLQQNEGNFQKNLSESLKKWSTFFRQLNENDQKIQNQKREVERLNKELITPRRLALDESSKQLEALNKVAEETQSKATQSNIQEDRDSAQSALKNAEAARRTVDEKQRFFNEAFQTVKAKEDMLRNLENISEGFRMQVKSGSLQEASTAITQMESAQKAAAESQVTANQKQEAVISSLSSQKKSPPQKEKQKRIFHSKPSLEGKNLAELYEEAVKADQRIAEIYKMLRATELAAIRKISLKEALKAIQVAKLDYEPLEMELLSGMEADKRLDDFRNQALKADQQIGSMLSLSGQMLSTAQGQKGLSQGEIQAGEWLENQRKKSELMEKQSQGDSNLVGKDMTSLMTRMANGIADPNAAGESASSSYIVPSYRRAAPELPNLDLSKIKALPSRKFSAKGTQRAEWLYIDSWYLIGPFPNRNRENLHTKFPPEMVIDLDATYPGKDGKPIRWNFIQWGQARLRIPHDTEEVPCVYYAYTELFFDEPSDLWIAMGSDDKGTVWINDILVWESWDAFKAWIPNEAYRKVHFIKGRNKVLYRIENGQSVAMMSMMISARKP